MPIFFGIIGRILLSAFLISVIWFLIWLVNELVLILFLPRKTGLPGG